MTGEKLHKDILDYRRGTFRVSVTSGGFRDIPFDPAYKKELFDRIAGEIAARGGRFVLHREQYTIRGDEIVYGMA